MVCGGFEKLTPGAPLALLGGQLNFAALPGFAAQESHSDLLAASASNSSETKLTLTAGAKKLSLHARQLYRKAPEGLVSALQKVAGKGAAVESYNPQGLSGALVTPSALEDHGNDAWLVLSAYTQSPDGLIQQVDFLANKAALGGGSGKGCTALAKKLAEGLSLGPNKVDLSGGRRKFAGHAIKIPADVVMVPERGPDFSVYHFLPVLPFDAPGGEALIYIGGFPEPLPPSGEAVRGAAFGAVRVWRENVTEKQENGANVRIYTRRTIVPLANNQSADLNVEARDPELLKTLAAMLANTF